MRKNILHASLFCLISTFSFAQNYWQQEVNYKIDVKLDDVNHVITANESFVYINNSPDKLAQIYIHLWPNAYRDGNSALGKQLYKNGEEFLTFADEKDKGGIDSLDFKVNGEKVKWEYLPKNMDVCVLMLAKSLNPGESMVISTPFKVKLPSGKISRLGHIEQSYQITQWYPKPAVYDKNGWNWMPYLNQGEFYSEYGSFDVSITLPKNYVVGSTGDLQTASEIEFLNELASKTSEKIKSNTYTTSRKEKTAFPESSKEWKTIRYIQSKVHDFAWFADKRFDVLKGEVELPNSKRKVTSWAMYVPQNGNLWQKSIEYINDATFYYSKWNGDYPYNQVTAVDGTISAGGGMEYPNVTVIGNSSNSMELEIVIVHEVGHNWFYGILGSNERIHGWMDEGMNTLNEMRYVATKYPENKNMSDMVLGGRFHLNDLDHHDMGDISYRTIAILGEDQPIETKSADFSSTNYGVIMYQKTGLAFFYLKDYLGETAFNKAMSDYFEAYKFKHPQPEDMQRVLEQSTGKNLDWLFHDLIQTTNHIDYKIKSVKTNETETKVRIKNVGQVDGPIGVSAIKDGKIVETVWLEPGTKKTSVSMATKNAEFIQIDPNKNVPELDRSNNNWKKDQLFNKIEPLKFEFLIGDHEATKSNNFWMPVIGANRHDRLMLGVAIHNIGIPFKKFQYFVAPVYSFGRKNISGTGEMSFTFLPKSCIKLTRVGMSVRTFKNDSYFRGNESYYAAAMPYVYMKLGNRKSAGPISQTLLFQTIYRNDKYGPTTNDHAGGYAKYTFDYNKPDHQFGTVLRADFIDNLKDNSEMSRASFEATYRYKYLKNKMKRWIEIRAFIGGNLSYKTNGTYGNRLQMSLAGTNGSQDIFLEEYFFDRTNTSNFGSNNQRLENQGGFKMSSNFGTTDKWMTSANLYFDLPLKPGIFGIFVDAGGFQKGNTFTGVLSTGIGVKLSKVFSVYFPVYMSKNLVNVYKATDAKYLEKIRFTIRLNALNKPFKLGDLL